MSLFGAIEGGGTKFVCAVGTAGGELRAENRFPTTTPDETIGRAIDFLLREIIASHDRDVVAIAQCVEQLEGESNLHALAEEILGNAKGHLDILAELVKEE